MDSSGQLIAAPSGGGLPGAAGGGPAAARDRGAAAIWITRSDLVWRDASVPAALRLRLGEHGLVPAAPTA